MSYEITDDMLSRSSVGSEEELILAFGTKEVTGESGNATGERGEVVDECPYEIHDSVRPKFDSVGAMILWQWSLDSSYDEDCGESQYGNGWHALFRSERAVLHTDSAGFVSARRVEVGKDLDTVWGEIEAGAVYSDDVECEGH